jgi:hypothetical protein
MVNGMAVEQLFVCRDYHGVQTVAEVYLTV